MKTFVRTLVLGILTFPLLSFAQVIPVPPPTPSVNVPDHCTVVDSDGGAHQYSGQYLGICALQTAISDGDVSGVVFSNAFPSLGLFVTAINGVTANPDSQYWALYQNGSFASLGLSQLPVVAGDTIDLQLHDFSDNFLGSDFTFNVNSLVSSAPAQTTSGGGGGGVWYHPPFDVPKAFDYLASVQGADGSFGSPMLSDWVAIATAAGDSGNIKNKLASYEGSQSTVLSVITENERHAMALEALGIDPYSAGGQDYISPIVASFNGTQIGDPSLVNDDIFAIFPLLHAGYTLQDPVIASTTAFIISKQSPDGSWAGSVDLTAAAIQVLKLLPDTGENRYAISKAVGYLHGKQRADGGFGDPYSSSWMLQAISAMNDTSSDWQQAHLTPDYYLATLQGEEGGIMASSTQDSIWATAYAIPGIRRATWDSLLRSFPKPAQVPPAATTTVTDASGTPLTVSTENSSGGADVNVKDRTPQAGRSTSPPTTSGTAGVNDVNTMSQTAAAASIIQSNTQSSLDYVGLYVLLLLIYLGAFAYRFRKRTS